MKSSRCIYFRADATPNIGYGHFMRCLALMRILKPYFDCKLVTIQLTPYQLYEVEKVGGYVLLSPIENHKEAFLNIVGEQDIVVLDNYFYSVEDQRRIKEKVHSLVYIDDRKSITYDCDIIINHVIGITSLDLTCLSKQTLLFLGPSFALLRYPFLESMKHYNPVPKNNKILVAMGGTDYNNFTSHITKILLANTSYDIDVLVGDAFQFVSEVESLDTKNRISIHRNLDEFQIVELLKNVTLVFSPPSTFAYEVCAIGRPLILGSFTPEHSDVAKLLAKNGLAENLGSLYTLTEQNLFTTLQKVISNMMFYIENQKSIFNGSQEKKLINIFTNLDDNN